MTDHWADAEGFGWHRLRWIASFLLMAGLFAGGIWAALHWAPGIGAPPAPPPAAMMVELAPLPAAPPAPPDQAPPGPNQKVAQPPPPVPPSLLEALPAPMPAIPAMVPPKPRPVEKHRLVKHVAPRRRIPDKALLAKATTALPQTQAAPAAAAFSPAATPAQTLSADAIPSWQGQLMQRLETFRRYPPLAQLRGEQGVVYLRFSMDRNGNVLSASIVKSGGYGELDEETLELIHRAAPLPKPPSEVPGDPIVLTVPIQFFFGNPN